MTTILITFLAGYLLWTAAYLLYERHERRKRQRESEETLPRKVADAEDILGKSTFSLCHSTPQVPEKTETVEPMEYRETDAGEPPIDEDEMLEGYAPKATGLRFEDMGLAVRMAMDDSTATEAERQQAGRALAELKGTPMFDQLTAGDAERERRIASLIELHLADYRRIRQPEPPAESIVPGDFSIDDIV